MRRRVVRVATFATALALDLLFFQPAGIPGPGELDLSAPWGDLAATIAVQERHTDRFLEMPGVVGTAIAVGPDGRPAVKVFLSALGAVSLPAQLEGHPLLVEVTGPFHALGDMPEAVAATGRADDATLDPKRSFPRPVPIGVSTGQVDVTAGTIGARVQAGADVFALSNNHVYANKNQAKLGDYILQPGVVDGGSNPTDAIGTLHDFEPIRFCSPFPICPDNRIDAAIAATSPDNLGNSTPENGYGTPRTRTQVAKLGMAVQKYGRTTGHTKGTVSGLNATLNVGFRDGTARFVGQIVISGNGFSAPGDSGSLIVSGGSDDGSRRPVGLLFAGSQTSTLANPIDLVLDRFGVEIDGN